ncbi:MAG TPA: TadE family type IV pilus minor pilin [Candidatus Nanopelagicales bacterium]
MVSAELAIALPGLVAVAVMLAWLLSLGFAQGGLAQAAREGARAAARGESAAVVREAVHRLAPGARVTVRRRAEQVVVTAAERREPPLALLRPFAQELRASATSWREEP